MSRYASAHANVQGPGDARPTALQIIEDEELKGKLYGKVIVITGTSSGIGIETARALALTGARLFLTARNVTKAKDVLGDIFDHGYIELVEMEQTSFHSVRTAARNILTKTDKINILINNAGVLAGENRELTDDGYELHFQTNHLSHFLFFELLKPALLKAISPDFHSRVIVVSSSLHHTSGINASDNYNFEHGGYTNVVAYGQSKTANIYMANEIERRHGSQGLHALSVHPGGILTNLPRHASQAELDAWKKVEGFSKTLKSPEQGAATSVWAAIGRQLEGKGGKYLADVAEADASTNAPDDNQALYRGYAKHAYSPKLETRLWEDSLKLVGLE
ncbi:hypothetical protein NM208_g8148 [Fusarium decemcellulare]|uniref:Uncharacterized protein n=1 Tax=Fusarium decemcellulare TaxID=57161 RepID=A0ACC1S6I8_9HYPO|nr:hypothetical protein NM208_g8148 [Fusarium decemcellulare]